MPPIANPARVRRRHWGILFSFVLLVVLPTAAAVYYLYAIAVDQFESRVGFAVRTEETESALDLLSGFSGISKASSSDTDILYEYIQSQEMVERVDQELDLRTMFSQPDSDPVFALPKDASIEDLVDYWSRMVKVYYDSSTGLIELRAFAFTPEDAHRLAQLVFDESSRKINALSAIAREDATRYTADERDKAIERLIAARKAMTAFRIENQIVDPAADIAGQMGLLNALQAQLAEELIERDKLMQTSKAGDPRLDQLARTIKVIEARIADERRKLAIGGEAASEGGDPVQGYAEVVGEYEKLQVDLEFAEAAYVSALGAHDAAVAEALRTSRYLTAYLRPTYPQTSTAPDRLLLSVLVAGFLFAGWFILLLVYYSLRDRR